MGEKTVFAGVFLLVSSILNMLVRIGVFLDFAVSGLLVVGGVCVLAMKEWDSKGVFGLVCGLAGLTYTPIKLVTLYFILASILHLNRFWLLGLGLVFLLPMLGLCLASTLLLLGYRKSFFSSIRVEVLDPIEKKILVLIAKRKPDFMELKSRLNLEEEELRKHLKKLEGLVELDYRKRYRLTNVGKATYMRIKEKNLAA